MIFIYLMATSWAIVAVAEDVKAGNCSSSDHCKLEFDRLSAEEIKKNRYAACSKCDHNILKQAKNVSIDDLTNRVLVYKYSSAALHSASFQIVGDCDSGYIAIVKIVYKNSTKVNTRIFTVFANPKDRREWYFVYTRMDENKIVYNMKLRAIVTAKSNQNDVYTVTTCCDEGTSQYRTVHIVVLQDAVCGRGERPQACVKCDAYNQYVEVGKHKLRIAKLTETHVQC